nr:cell division cycle 5-like protein [Ipomoea batatas]
MRIMIKGGVWKNTEDEILKAAVMKYGKNQWARISSLLVRKSAKQCKARWYEWLDPSIKKTEWTREEDEKLLHLAKLMPTQWRTIAPIVGRTPSQCLERYEKLLDAACAKDENYEAGDDPRKLRPGEIDPNPESKPARPDPVDMDEDEKEMLSEARARLANTRGKKAKRKAREKQLEEARRLASLQKRRELKAAGIDVRHRKRKRKGIDYNAEIPFEKKPPPGFYDVTDEDRTVEQPKFPTTIEELEGERRVDKEARLRKQDIARNKIAQRQDAPSAILHANKLNDPETVRKRTKLNLPAPQISDHELEAIAKFGIASDLIGSEELLEGNAATRALVANYTQTPRQGMTPLRTPQRTPANKQDAIMMEAENQRRLSQSQTPLLGGTGLTPRIGMTPSSDGYSFGMTPKGTPMRDELHINEEMDMDGGKVARSDSRLELRSRLGSLPNPKNEYQIVMQPLPEESEEPEEKIEEDMSKRIAREKAEEEARQQALLRKRSKALQRDLPRPPAASLDLIKSSLIRADEDKSSFVPPTLIEQADELIRRELLSLLEHDNVKYPIDEKSEKEKKKGTKRKSVSVPVIEDFEEDELKEAEDLIKDEAQFLRVAMGHETESIDEFVEAHKTCSSDIMYFPTRNAYGLSSVAGNMEKLSALQFEFENVKKKMDDDTKKAQNLEQKVKVLTNGYQFRAGKIWSQIEATFKQMDTAGTELECFKVLQKQELLAASNRINNIWEEVQKQKDLERTLQKRYGDLLVEKERIEYLMDEYKKQAQMQEIEAKNRALELELATAEGDAADNKMIVAPSNEDPESVAYVNEHDPAQESPNKQAEDGSSMAVDPAQESPNKQEDSMADDPAQENPNEPTDNAQEQPSGSPKLGMDIDEVGSTTDTNELSQSTPAARESSLTDEVHAENACNESESGVTSGSPKLMNADENPTSGIGGEASADAFVSPITEDQVS